MEVQVIWGLFIFGMFFLVIRLVFGLMFGSNDDFDEEFTVSSENPLWEEKSNAEKIKDEQTGYYDHGLGFYTSQNG